jgi:hypothetical protein
MAVAGDDELTVGDPGELLSRTNDLHDVQDPKLPAPSEQLTRQV